jgi:hypothetical protein
MIPQELIPRALRSASAEEQLAYLLERRKNIDRILRSLERYVQERETATVVRSLHGYLHSA